MRLPKMILSAVLVSCSLWMIGCVGPKSKPLHDGNLPLLEIYDQHGARLEGYEAHPVGYVANMVKRCNAILDEWEKAR